MWGVYPVAMGRDPDLCTQILKNPKNQDFTKSRFTKIRIFRTFPNIDMWGVYPVAMGKDPDLCTQV
jgi:hypothetical protein